MKNFSPFIILLFLSVNLIYSQKSLDSDAKTERNLAIKEGIKAKSQKHYKTNWKKVNVENNQKTSWSSLKPNKKASVNGLTKKSKSSQARFKRSSRPEKTKKLAYPSTFNNSNKETSVTKSGSLTKTKTTVAKSNRRAKNSNGKKVLFSRKKENK